MRDRDLQPEKFNTHIVDRWHTFP